MHVVEQIRGRRDRRIEMTSFRRALALENSLAAYKFNDLHADDVFKDFAVQMFLFRTHFWLFGLSVYKFIKCCVTSI